MAEEKYLAIKNWGKYQASMGKRDWIKDYTDKDSHPEYSKLTLMQRGLLDGIQRWCGAHGENIPNDTAYIARALLLDTRDRAHTTRLLRALIAAGFLLPSNQQHSFLKSVRGEEIREEEKRVEREIEHPKFEASEPAPKVLTPMKPIEVAPYLCDVERFNLSGEHNHRMVADVVAKGMLFWNVDAQAAAERIWANRVAYLKAPLGDEKKKQPVRFWLSDGAWNVDVFAVKPARPLYIHERTKLREMGVNMNQPTAKLFEILRGMKANVQ